MKRGELDTLLESAVPRLGLRWSAYHRVGGTVRKRLRHRLAVLGIVSPGEYAARLEREPAELRELDALCRIPVSRVYRDAEVWDALVRTVLPERAAVARSEGRGVRAWSAGCARGEEPYTLAAAWWTEIAPAFPDVPLTIVATDLDDSMLEGARRATYDRGSFREAPEELQRRAFEPDGDRLRVRDEVRRAVELRREDLREAAPDGPFDLVLCRNSAFSYFDEQVQRAVAMRIVERLRPGGALVVGLREELPAEASRALALLQPCIHVRTR